MRRKIGLSALAASVAVVCLIAYVAVPGERPEEAEAVTAGPVIRTVVGGETVVGSDGAVSVSFTPTGVSPGTKVRITPSVDAPPPPAQFLPISPAFDITPVAGGVTSGTVEVALPPLPSGVDPASVLMVVEEGSGWQLLDTDVDVAAGVVTAHWPHFSMGGLVIPDPFAQFNPSPLVPSSWGYEAAAAAAAWFDTQRLALQSTVADALTTVLLPVAGGTKDVVKCDPNVGDEWLLAGYNPNGGTHTPALNGCVHTRSPEGHWSARIGNHAPLPYLVELPSGVSVNWTEVMGDHDLFDGLVSMGAARLERTIIPGGKSSRVQLAADAPAELQLHGYVDPTTLAVRTATLVAAVYTFGGVAAARHALQADLKRQVDEFDRLYAGGGKTMDDFIEMHSWDSPYAKGERQLAKQKAAHVVSLTGLMIGLTTCGYGALNGADLGTGTLDEQTARAFRAIREACYAPFVEAATSLKAQEVSDAITLKVEKELLTELVAAAQDVPRLVAVVVAGAVKLLDGPDYIRAGVRVTKRPPKPVQPPQSPTVGCGQQAAGPVTYEMAAACLREGWKRGDRALAETYGTSTAVDDLFLDRFDGTPTPYTGTYDLTDGPDCGSSDGVVSCWWYIPNPGALHGVGVEMVMAGAPHDAYVSYVEFYG